MSTASYEGKRTPVVVADEEDDSTAARRGASRIFTQCALIWAWTEPARRHWRPRRYTSDPRPAQGPGGRRRARSVVQIVGGQGTHASHALGPGDNPRALLPKSSSASQYKIAGWPAFLREGVHPRRDSRRRIGCVSHPHGAHSRHRITAGPSQVPTLGDGREGSARRDDEQSPPLVPHVSAEASLLFLRSYVGARLICVLKDPN